MTYIILGFALLFYLFGAAIVLLLSFMGAGETTPWYEIVFWPIYVLKGLGR